MSGIEKFTIGLALLYSVPTILFMSLYFNRRIELSDNEEIGAISAIALLCVMNGVFGLILVVQSNIF